LNSNHNLLVFSHGKKQKVKFLFVKQKLTLPVSLSTFNLYPTALPPSCLYLPKMVTPVTNSQTLVPQPSQQHVWQWSASQGMGDPLMTLACKGVNKENKADIKILVAAILFYYPNRGDHPISCGGSNTHLGAHSHAPA
jgi:hypothetical protein